MGAQKGGVAADPKENHAQGRQQPLGDVEGTDQDFPEDGSPQDKGQGPGNFPSRTPVSRLLYFLIFQPFFSIERTFPQPRSPPPVGVWIIFLAPLPPPPGILPPASPRRFVDGGSPDSSWPVPCGSVSA
jgi:hypothetical protein